MKKQILFALFSAMLMLLPLGLAQSQVVGMAIQDEPATLDPIETIQLSALQVLNFIMEPLVYIGPDGTPQGWVAESWDVSEDSRTVTFKIREGRRFHDGTEIDAHAVEFSINRHLNSASPHRAGLGTLESVEVLDEYTIQFNYSEPYASIWTTLSSPFLGMISPTAAEQHGDQLGRNLVGSGPFKLSEWVPASGFNLERFEGYTSPRIDIENQGEVKIDELRVRIIPEEGTRMAALEVGEIHFGDAPREEIDRLQEDPNFNVVISENDNNLSMIEMNPFKAPTDDVRVRQAIAHAVNIEDIGFVAYAGLSTPNYAPLPRGNTGYNPEIGEKYGYRQDHERMAELLQEAGYERNSEGVWSRDGQPLTLVFWTYTLPNGTKGGQVIQQQLTDAGFNVQMETFEVASMIGQLKDLNHNINFMWWSGWDPIFLSYVFRTPGWAGVYHNPELDEILDNLETELDPERRQAYIDEAQIFLLEDAGVVPIGTNWRVLLTRSDLQGLKLDALSNTLLNDAEIVR